MIRQALSLGFVAQGTTEGGGKDALIVYVSGTGETGENERDMGCDGLYSTGGYLDVVNYE